MEFDYDFFYSSAVKILVSTLLGGLIGAEREYKVRNIGFRTIILICLGSALFTILSIVLGQAHDPTRIASNVLTGVGFLGAGAIFREGVNVKGMTTAAIIWISAAIGMACGMGEFALAVLVTFTVLIILIAFAKIQGAIDSLSQERTYKIGMSKNTDLQKELEEEFLNLKLHAKGIKFSKQDDKLRIEYEIRGSENSHRQLIYYLSTKQYILEFEV